MRKSLEKQLQKIVKGTGFILLANVVGTVLGFLFRIIVVRYISKSEYGLLSLAIAITNILAVFCSLGLVNSIPRFIAHSLAQRNYARILETIRVSIKVIVFSSIFVTSILFLFANRISVLLHKPALNSVIRVFSFVLPFSVLTEIFISILRGFEDVKGKIFLQNIFLTGIKIFLVTLVVFLGFSFTGVLWSYLIASVLTAVVLLFYVKACVEKFVPRSLINHRATSVKKELVFFSLPLFGSSILKIVNDRVMTLILGYFKPANFVAHYNVALPIAQFISIPLMATVFIYLPVASKLHASSNMRDLKILYSTISKWTFLCTVPVFLLLFLYPAFVIKMLFGARYLKASAALQCLTLGFLVHTLLGPNGMTLIAFGKTEFMLLASGTSSLLGITSAFVLIPKYGFIGAAVATALALIVTNLLASFFLFKVSNIHPFNIRYVKLLSVIGIITFVWHWLIQTDLFPRWGTLVFTCIMLSILVVVVVKNYLTEEDLWLLNLLKKNLNHHSIKE